MDKIDEILNKIEVVGEIMSQQAKEGYYDKVTADCYLWHLEKYTEKMSEEFEEDNKEIKRNIKIVKIIIGVNIAIIITNLIISLI